MIVFRPKSGFEYLLWVINFITIILTLSTLAYLPFMRGDDFFEYLRYAVSDFVVILIITALIYFLRKSKEESQSNKIKYICLIMFMAMTCILFLNNTNGPIVLTNAMIVVPIISIFSLQNIYRYIWACGSYIFNWVLLLTLTPYPWNASGLFHSDYWFSLIVHLILFATISVLERERLRALSQGLLERAKREQEAALRLQSEDLASMRERNRIAREIHDGLGHHLTSINALAAALGSTSNSKAIEDIRRLSQDGLVEIRRSVTALRESTEAALPLVGQLRQLATESSTAGLPARLGIFGDRRILSEDIEHAIYRVVQEALNNTRKHGQASSVSINLQYTPASVVLQIADDGCGTSILTSEGYGLIGMRERVMELGGNLDIETRPNQGFKIYAEVPA